MSAKKKISVPAAALTLILIADPSIIALSGLIRD